MFHRFNNSARSVLFRAHENAISEGNAYVEPNHILIALRELYPEVFARLFGAQPDAEAVRQDLRLEPNPSGIAHGSRKVRFGDRTKQVLVDATEEGHLCWQQWEAPRRKAGTILPEDVAYWGSRLNHPKQIPSRPGWFMRWTLRRRWEVDERHLLLALLKSAECPITASLAEQSVSLDSARQRLCART